MKKLWSLLLAGMLLISGISFSGCKEYVPELSLKNYGDWTIYFEDEMADPSSLEVNYKEYIGNHPTFTYRLSEIGDRKFCIPEVEFRYKDGKSYYMLELIGKDKIDEETQSEDPVPYVNKKGNYYIKWIIYNQDETGKKTSYGSGIIIKVEIL